MVSAEKNILVHRGVVNVFCNQHIIRNEQKKKHFHYKLFTPTKGRFTKLFLYKLTQSGTYQVKKL